MSEKTEKATSHKLQKAREQGQVSKSIELNTCVFLLVTVITALALWPAFWLELKQLITHLLYLAARLPFSVDGMGHLQRVILSKLTSWWLPFALAGIVALTLSTVSQTGFVWSGKPIVPDFKRLDIAKGFKRLFSTKLLFDAAKNSLKLVLVIALLSLSVRHELTTLLGLMSTYPANLPTLLIHLLSKVLLQLISLLFALALIDKLYTRWKFAKDQRMSKQELKDEYRQREGDPKIKAKIRQLQQQLRQKTASLELVKTADVVITNPTHLAIALQYDKHTMPAPKVVCKAQGEMVKQVKQLAAKHRIPIIENKLFARALFATTDLNRWIKREHYPVAAMIFREIYQQRMNA